MSYSISVRAANKTIALGILDAEFDKVREAQPAHKVDIDQAAAAAEAFVKVLSDDPSRDVIVSISGSVNTVSSAEGVFVSQLNFSFNGGLASPLV